MENGEEKGTMNTLINHEDGPASTVLDAIQTFVLKAWEVDGFHEYDMTSGKTYQVKVNGKLLEGRPDCSSFAAMVMELMGYHLGTTSDPCLPKITTVQFNSADACIYDEDNDVSEDWEVILPKPGYTYITDDQLQPGDFMTKRSNGSGHIEIFGAVDADLHRYYVWNWGDTGPIRSTHAACLDAKTTGKDPIQALKDNNGYCVNSSTGNSYHWHEYTKVFRFKGRSKKNDLRIMYDEDMIWTGTSTYQPLRITLTWLGINYDDTDRHQFFQTFADVDKFLRSCDSEEQMFHMEVDAGCENVLTVPFNAASDSMYNTGLPTLYEGIQNHLYRLTIGDHITEIGKTAFINCKQLVDVQIGNGCTKIGMGAFSGCSKLNQLAIGENVARIEDGAFFDTMLPETLNIPDSVLSIGMAAFGCNITDYEYDENGKVISSQIRPIDDLTRSNLKKVNFGIGIGSENGSHELPDALFVGRSGLGMNGTLKIPDGITKLGSATFMNCPYLKSIDLNDVEELGSAVFALQDPSASLSTMKKTYTANGNSRTVDVPVYINDIGIRSIDLSHIKKAGQAVFQHQPIEELTIPGTFVFESNNTFIDMEYLRTVTVESGVTSLGIQTFQHCYELKTIHLPNTLIEIGGLYPEHTSTSYVGTEPHETVHPAEYQGKTFVRCYSLESIELPSSLKYIRESSFAECIALKSINLPQSVETIGEYAFSNCYSLETITTNKALNDLAGSPWGAPDTCEIAWNV